MNFKRVVSLKEYGIFDKLLVVEVEYQIKKGWFKKPETIIEEIEYCKDGVRWFRTKDWVCMSSDSSDRLSAIVAKYKLENR
jgi:hypothetical protein